MGLVRRDTTAAKRVVLKDVTGRLVLHATGVGTTCIRLFDDAKITYIDDEIKIVGGKVLGTLVVGPYADLSQIGGNLCLKMKGKFGSITQESW